MRGQRGRGDGTQGQLCAHPKGWQGTGSAAGSLFLCQVASGGSCSWSVAEAKVGTGLRASTGLGNGPGGVCWSGGGRVGDRATCSPGTRDFFQSHPECPWRGWAQALYRAGTVAGAAPVPRAPGSQCDPQVTRLPCHSWVAGGTSCCETLTGAPTPSSSTSAPLSCPFSPAWDSPATGPWVTLTTSHSGLFFPHQCWGHLGDNHPVGSGQPHGSVPGEALEATV